MIKLRQVVVLFCFFPLTGFTIPTTAAKADVTEVRYFQVDERYEYRIKLLDLVMSKTSQQWGGYRLVGLREPITQARGSILLEQNTGVDIAALPTSFERENKLQAIPFPILNGILGYRVLLIRESDQETFSGISTFEQIKNLTGGFVNHWSDFKLLEHNGLSIMKVPRYELLFPMLAKRRFDYIPRGINEAWIEVNKPGNAHRQLAVEQGIGFYYPYHVYFFVSRQNPELAQRIREGMETSLQDGSFKALFLQYHEHLFKQASLASRKLFVLKNPNMPPVLYPPKLDWWLPVKLSEPESQDSGSDSGPD